MTPNKRVETNRRHAPPFSVSSEFECAECAQSFMPAAVAHPQR